MCYVKLKYSLFELNGKIVFTIFYMDSRFRCATSEFLATNGWRVLSQSHPGIDCFARKIYLQGEDPKLDSCVVVDPGLESKPTKALINEIDEALKEWAEYWPGWQQESCDSKVSLIKEV